MLWDPKKDLPIQTDDPWRQVLRDAADHIEQDGWCQLGPGLKTAGSNPRCAANAIWLAREANRQLAIEARRHFCRHLGVRDAEGIWDWNDAPERTKEEVVSALRAAAESTLL